jgi:hypothetical protein
MHRQPAEAGVRPHEQQRPEGDQIRDHRVLRTGRSIQIQDERLDQDWTSPDDPYGTTPYTIRSNGAATQYKSVLKVLPDADARGDDNEEMYHAVRFQVTSDNGVVSAWTPRENSPVVSFHL